MDSTGSVESRRTPIARSAFVDKLRKWASLVPSYVILGACNPPFAHRALQTEKDIGLLLPCNIIVYEDGGETYVSAIVPTVAMSMVDNADLGDVARQVEAKLKKVIDSV